MFRSFYREVGQVENALRMFYPEPQPIAQARTLSAAPYQLGQQPRAPCLVERGNSRMRRPASGK